MELFGGMFFGFCMGFGFGVGCALAVMYTIYMDGYKKGIEDSLRTEKSERYRKLLPKIQARLIAKERKSAGI